MEKRVIKRKRESEREFKGRWLSCGNLICHWKTLTVCCSRDNLTVYTFQGWCRRAYAVRISS